MARGAVLMTTNRHIDSTPSLQGPTVPPPQPMGLAPALERNIQAMVRRRTEEAEAEGLQDRLAQAITNFSGSMTFVYLHLRHCLLNSSNFLVRTKRTVTPTIMRAALPLQSSSNSRIQLRQTLTS